MNERYLTPEGSVLGDLDLSLQHPPVNKGIRFANLLLDGITIWALNWIFTKALLTAGIDLQPASTHTGAIDLAYLQTLMGVFLRAVLVGMVFNTVYYTITEGLLKGQSVGKLITGTQAVNARDYAPVTLPQALIRSLCRQIPFENIGALFVQPWHDTITGTTVISKRKQ